jgi:hypothetical protein
MGEQGTDICQGESAERLAVVLATGMVTVSKVAVLRALLFVVRRDGEAGQKRSREGGDVDSAVGHERPGDAVR